MHQSDEPIDIVSPLIHYVAIRSGSELKLIRSESWRHFPLCCRIQILCELYYIHGGVLLSLRLTHTKELLLLMGSSRMHCSRTNVTRCCGQEMLPLASIPMGVSTRTTSSVELLMQRILAVLTLHLAGGAMCYFNSVGCSSHSTVRIRYVL